MKKLTYLITVCAIGFAFVGGFPHELKAGPGPQTQLYTPVKTQAQLDALKPNTRLAITCPDCGMVVVTKVAKDRHNLKTFDCSVCKHSFQITPVAGGKGIKAELVCTDSKGHKMPLHLCAEMHK